MKFCITCLFVACWMTTTLSRAQSVTYGYDAAGNRISRTISVSHVKERGFTTDAESPSSTDSLTGRVNVTVDNSAQSVVVQVNGLKSTDRCSVSLYSVSGQHLHTIAPAAPRTVVSLIPYPAGVYIIHVTLNGIKDSWKVLVQ